MNPEEIQSIFAARIDLFKPISGNPIDADLTCLHEDLTTTLLPLPYDVENVIHNILGLVMDKEDYKQSYRTKFPTLTKPSVYDEKILDNATNVDPSKSKAVHKANIADYQLFAAAKLETCDFIHAVVYDS